MLLDALNLLRQHDYGYVPSIDMIFTHDCRFKLQNFYNNGDIFCMSLPFTPSQHIHFLLPILPLPHRQDVLAPSQAAQATADFAASMVCLVATAGADEAPYAAPVPLALTAGSLTARYVCACHPWALQLPVAGFDALFPPIGHRLKCLACLPPPPALPRSCLAAQLQSVYGVFQLSSYLKAMAL